MPKRAKELGALEVSRLKDDGSYLVGGVPGLYLNVVGASRAWVLRYTSPASKKRRRMGIGAFPLVTLAKAREKARSAADLLNDGIDPLENQHSVRVENIKASRKQIKFRDAAIECIKSKKSEWSNPKHALQWESTLATYANPVLGDMFVADIDTQDILAVLNPIWLNKTETASRVRGRIETVLAWSTVMGYRDKAQPNPAAWNGNLDHLLPKRGKLNSGKHHEAVPFKEVESVFRSVAGSEGQGARALLLQILTATRSGEVRGALWSEIDMEAGLWVIPADRMKAKREHRVPLSRQALALLASQERVMGVDLVFPSTLKKPISDMTITAVMRRMGLTAVPHGFRSTFRDWASETTDFDGDVVEMALAHVIKNKVEAAYRRGDLLEKRQALMQAWADYCAPLTPSR